MLEGKRVTVISSLRGLKMKGVWEETYLVTRFRRALQPEGDRKKLLLQVYAHDASQRLHKTDVQMGGRMRTFAAEDIAEIR